MTESYELLSKNSDVLVEKPVIVMRKVHALINVGNVIYLFMLSDGLSCTPNFQMCVKTIPSRAI